MTVLISHVTDECLKAHLTVREDGILSTALVFVTCGNTLGHSPNLGKTKYGDVGYFALSRKWSGRILMELSAVVLSNLSEVLSSSTGQR